METSLYPKVAQDVKDMEYPPTNCTFHISHVENMFIRHFLSQNPLSKQIIVTNVIIFGCQSIFCYPLSVNPNLHVYNEQIC